MASSSGPNASCDSECVPICAPFSTEGKSGRSTCISMDASCAEDERCIRLCYATSPAPIPADTPSSDQIVIIRKLCAEFIGTGLLVMIVVGSGITGENLSDDVGIQLLINSVATAAGLYGLISIFGPVSGAHFNPLVSLVDCLYGDMNIKNLAMYSVAQVVGGIAGTIVANVQFEEPVLISDKERWGYNLWISEVIATASLILIIHGCIRTGQESSVPYAVSARVGGGYFFTSSSIFANPAVTIARVFTRTFAGIDPPSMGAYIGFQIVGALIGYGLSRAFYPHHAQQLNNDDNLYRRACVLDLKDFFNKESY